jgi:hypothetical protein
MTALALCLALGAPGAACGGATPQPAPLPPAFPSPHEPPPLPGWTYWEPVLVPALEGVKPAQAPVDPGTLSMTVASEARWKAAPQRLREALVLHGVAVTRLEHPQLRLGDFYASLRDDRVPWVVTMDALFFLAHLALDRTLADMDASVLAPAVATMLRRLDVRLATESRGAPADLAAAYLVARGVVGVALAFVDSAYTPPAELAPLVEGERARVVAHSAVGVSPWLGVPVDYTAMAPAGAADRDEAHAGWYRAVAWLELAGLALEGRGEDRVHSQVDVGTARIHARAAMLLTRMLTYELDAEAATAWDRIERSSELLVGEAADATPRQIQAAATKAKLDLLDRAWLANVVAVDRVRRAVARGNGARVDDGFAGARVPAAGFDPLAPIGRLSPSFRLVAPRDTPDAELLQALVFPMVGRRTVSARADVRALPSSLDVAAWLGSGDARAILHETGDDAYGRYADTLDRLTSARPPNGSIERHRTPYLSLLDAVETWLGPSIGDRVQPGASTAEWRARKAEVALDAWTALRHDARPMARLQSTDLRLPAPEPTPSPVPVFVEPHPEAIAKLLAFVRQLERAMVADGALPPHGAAVTVLDEVNDLLWDALGMATHEASDQPVPPECAARVATLPARLRALEDVLDRAGAADVPLVTDVHEDLPSARVLEEAIGRVEQAWMIVREPATHRLWLAFGAALPHAELVQPASARLSDGDWSARLASDGDPPPDALERPYLVLSK